MFNRLACHKLSVKGLNYADPCALFYGMWNCEILGSLTVGDKIIYGIRCDGMQQSASVFGNKASINEGSDDGKIVEVLHFDKIRGIADA